MHARMHPWASLGHRSDRQAVSSACRTQRRVSCTDINSYLAAACGTRKPIIMHDHQALASPVQTAAHVRPAQLGPEGQDTDSQSAIRT